MSSCLRFSLCFVIFVRSYPFSSHTLSFQTFFEHRESDRYIWWHPNSVKEWHAVRETKGMHILWESDTFRNIHTRTHSRPLNFSYVRLHIETFIFLHIVLVSSSFWHTCSFNLSKTIDTMSIYCFSFSLSRYVYGPPAIFDQFMFEKFLRVRFLLHSIAQAFDCLSSWLHIRWNKKQEVYFPSRAFPIRKYSFDVHHRRFFVHSWASMR